MMVRVKNANAAGATSDLPPTHVDAVSVAWLAAVEAALATPEDHIVSREFDLGGHELALIDFDPDSPDLDRLRRIARLIGIANEPSRRTALAISGSTAQGRVHPFPADADFFERVHLLAPDRASAIARFAALIRDNALATDRRPELGLDEVYFGRLPDATGDLARWTLPAVREGAVSRVGLDGKPLRVTWDSAGADPGFVKLDWWLLDPELGGPAKVSKVVDATWEAPDGRVESLDGLIDGVFQEIYLSVADATLAADLVRHAAPDLGRAVYLRFMDQEIVKYLRYDPPDYIKVAKRLYNRCRHSGHFAEAVWLRGLFGDQLGRLGHLRADLELISSRWADDAETAIALRRRVEDAAKIVHDLGYDPPPTAARLAQARSKRRLRQEIETFDALLAEVLAATFGRRLLAHPPIAALLQEIAAATPAPANAVPV